MHKHRCIRMLHTMTIHRLLTRIFLSPPRNSIPDHLALRIGHDGIAPPPDRPLVIFFIPGISSGRLGSRRHTTIGRRLFSMRSFTRRLALGTRRRSRAAGIPSSKEAKPSKRRQIKERARPSRCRRVCRRPCRCRRSTPWRRIIVRNRRRRYRDRWQPVRKPGHILLRRSCHGACGRG